MLKDGRRTGRPARGTGFRFQNLIVCRAGWTAPCGILDSTFFGPPVPGGPFSAPNKEATGTDFPFLNLSLQQGMRTFPPCAFSTSMLSGGPPIFERGPPQQPIVVRLRSESFQSDGIIVRTSHQLTFATWGNSGIVPYEVVIRCFGA
jgi:hypothetical protein